MTEIARCEFKLSPPRAMDLAEDHRHENTPCRQQLYTWLFECLLIGESSTFLKRKGGLFKKAHELSVLCSVDVAVIIFGHNKKLYEYSSGDINETIGRFQYVSVPRVLPNRN